VESRELWRQAATKELKGADPLEQLAWQAEPEIPMAPYYTAAEAEDWQWILPYQPFLGAQSAIINYVPVEIDSPKQANAKALEALKAGAEGVYFVGRNALSAHELEVLLHDILPQHCGVGFHITDPSFMVHYLPYLRQRDVAALHGFLVTDTPDISEQVLHSLLDVPNFYWACAPGQVSGADRLAHWLHLASKQVANAQAKGVHPSAILPRIIAFFVSGKSYFEDMAMYRAARVLFYQLARGYELTQLTPDMLQIFGEITPFREEAFAPHGTMLYHATAAMAALLGGCNGLCLQPEDNGPMPSRIARNVPLILKEEAYLDKVSDPAAGAYFIEHLTASIAMAAWKKFLQLQNA
jgi:methylmalonyl-CoA mutase